jgi:hypothetical protein
MRRVSFYTTLDMICVSANPIRRVVVTRLAQRMGPYSSHQLFMNVIGTLENDGATTFDLLTLSYNNPQNNNT